jgi:hypothetical protein
MSASEATARSSRKPGGGPSKVCRDVLLQPEFVSDTKAGADGVLLGFIAADRKNPGGIKFQLVAHDWALCGYGTSASADKDQEKKPSFHHRNTFYHIRSIGSQELGRRQIRPKSKPECTTRSS